MWIVLSLEVNNTHAHTHAELALAAMNNNLILFFAGLFYAGNLNNCNGVADLSKTRRSVEHWTRALMELGKLTE